MKHAHEPEHKPVNGTGYEVCSCGATRRVESGQPKGAWHACALCSHEAMRAALEGDGHP